MHNYLVSGGVIWAFVSLVWLLSLIKKDSSIIDPCWSLFFLAAALTTALRGSFPPEGSHFLLLAMVTLWSLRLSIHLFLRNSHEGEDYRYQQWRKNTAALGGGAVTSPCLCSRVFWPGSFASRLPPPCRYLPNR